MLVGGSNINKFDVLNIKDNHVNFFINLLRRFDFVKIESEKGFTELTDHQKSILDERLENNPESYLVLVHKVANF